MSDYIVFWMWHNAIPPLKEGQYVYLGKNGKKGQVRNRKSLSWTVMSRVMQENVTSRLKALAEAECEFFKKVYARN